MVGACVVVVVVREEKEGYGFLQTDSLRMMFCFVAYVWRN